MAAVLTLIATAALTLAVMTPELTRRWRRRDPLLAALNRWLNRQEGR